jgi:hypothetical protein
MIKEISPLIDNYLRWIKDKTVLKGIDDKWTEITTPYLDRHNDCMQLYVGKEKSGYKLTDDGYIINDLENAGCVIDSPKRIELLNTTLGGFGVKLENKALTINATTENFPVKKHNMIQAMLAINDLFYLASPYVSSLFMEDVTQWLDTKDIRYTPKIKLSGKSGYDHLFDFVIPKSKKQPERILQALSNPKKETAESLVFKWMDTKDTRAPESNLFVLLNDTTNKVSPQIIDAFNNYELRTILWSERDKFTPLLAA